MVRCIGDGELLMVSVMIGDDGLYFGLMVIIVQMIVVVMNFEVAML